MTQLLQTAGLLETARMVRGPLAASVTIKPS